MLARIARTAAARRVPAAFTPVSARGYSDSFKDRENAQEGQYVREQERAALEKLRKSIADKKAELDALEKEHAEKAK